MTTYELIAEMHSRYIEDMARHVRIERRLEKRLEWYQRRCAELSEDNEYLRARLDKLEQIQRILEV